MSERRCGWHRPGVWLWILGILTLTGSAWGGLTWWGARRVRSEVALARAEMEVGQFATARARLRGLSDGPPEALYCLGVCEQALGRGDAALKVWGRVGPGSPWFARAAVARATRFTNSGRYRPAEEALGGVLDGAHALHPADAYPIYRALSRLKRFEGQVDAVRHTLRDSWWCTGDAERPALLLELWFLDNSPQPLESWRLALERADPEDDRVWLGRAVVSTLTGKYAEAAKWLDACERARPDDPVVWRARLNLALDSGDESGVWRASAKLPADRVEASEPLAVAAWLLGRRGDRDAERRALRALVDADPGRVPPLDRLATLELQAGRHEEAERLHRRKSELDQAKDQVRRLLMHTEALAAEAGGLARLTGVLGRRFDAQAWAEVSGDIPTARTPVDDAPRRTAGTLADRLLASGLKPGPAAPAGLASTHAPAAADIPRFTDDAETAGLKFLYENGETPLHQLPEIMSGGVGVLDYDGDGWLDVYVVQGGPLVPGATSAAGTDRLFRNNRDGTFQDVSEASRVASFPRDYSKGVAVGDYDGDGRPDLFVSRLTSYALYRNQGDGTFCDVTAEAGLAGRRDDPTSAAFADLDGDGDLDLYVCHYMVWDLNDPRLCKNEKGDYFYCDPSRVDPAPDHVFRNDAGRFVDVTAEAGFTDPNGRGLGVVAADFDGDGRVDLFVANDGTGNYLFRNLGGFRFEETGLSAGVACNANGGYQASMGVACGDYNGDGRPDLLVTNFYGESSTLSENLGQGMFRDVTQASGVGVATRYLLGFGTAFADVDNDGRLDLVTANGHVNDSRPFYPFAMPAQLLLGRDGVRFDDASAQAGAVWGVLRLGRGLAAADLDNDGRVDILIVAQNEPMAYLHNRGPSRTTAGTGRFVTFGLEGTGSNRDGVGAVVTVVAGDRRQVATRFGGGSYQSAGDPRLHFGLGTAAIVDSVEVRWPSGKTGRFARLPAGTGYLLREGAGAAAPLKGFAPP